MGNLYADSCTLIPCNSSWFDARYIARLPHRPHWESRLSWCQHISQATTLSTHRWKCSEWLILFSFQNPFHILSVVFGNGQTISSIAFLTNNTTKAMQNKNKRRVYGLTPSIACFLIRTIPWNLFRSIVYQQRPWLPSQRGVLFPRP